MEIFALLKKQDTKALHALVKQKDGIININKPDIQGLSPFLLAAQTNQLVSMQLFIEYGAMVEAVDLDKRTALHHACIQGHTDCALYLLGLGLSLTQQNSSGQTPLHLAVQYNRASLLRAIVRATAEKALLEAATVVDISGKTVLHLLASQANPNLLNIFYQACPAIKTFLNQPENRSQWTPLHCAAFYGHAALVKALINYGADPRLTDKNNKTPAKLALDQQFKELALDIQRHEVQGVGPYIELSALIKEKDLSLSQRIVEPHFSMPWPQTFKNLVFEGGGVKGLVYAGALKVLTDTSLMPSVERVAGASAGAITALLIGLGYGCEQVENIISKMEFKKFSDSNWGLLRNTNRFFTDFGWNKGDYFLAWAKERVEEIMGDADATFADVHKMLLAQRQKCATYSQLSARLRDMYFIGVNLSTGCEEIFSFKHTPNLSIAQAVRISMSIPLYFAAKRMKLSPNGEVKVDVPKGDVYVDGGLMNNYPITLFDEYNFANPETLGFKVDDPEEIAYFNEGIIPEAGSIDSIVDYGKALVKTALRVQDMHHYRSLDSLRTVYIHGQGIGTTQFDLTPADQQKLLAAGKAATVEFLVKQLTTKKTFVISSAQQMYDKFQAYERKSIYRKASSIALAPINNGLYEVQLSYPQESIKQANKAAARLQTHTGVLTETVKWQKQLNNNHQTCVVVSYQCLSLLATELQQWLSKHDVANSKQTQPIKSESLSDLPLLKTYSPLLHTRKRQTKKLLQLENFLQAAEFGQLEKLKSLLAEGVPVNQTSHGYSALHKAVSANQVKTLGFLLTLPEVDLNAITAEGDTILHLAAASPVCSAELWDLLLTLNLNVNQQNKYGATPLHRAARFGIELAIKYLIQAGADSSIKDQDGHTPFETAAANQRQHVLALLSEAHSEDSRVSLGN